jgi:O-antigen ligase
MDFPASTLRWQRWLLAAMLLASAVLIVPQAVEPFMLGKMTFLVLLTLALLAVGAARAVWARSVRLPVSPVTIAVAALGVALVLSTVTSFDRWTSLVGFYGRYTGLIPYLSYLAVFLVVLRVTDLGLVRLLTRTALVALGAVVAYGLLQAAGLDPADLRDIGLGTTYSFFGNTNFSAAWAGATTAFALTVALSTAETTAWRVYAALLLPFTLIYIVLTRASQGVAVAALALGWVVLVLALTPGSRVRRAAAGRRTAVLGVVAAATVLLVVGVLATLPFLRAQLAQSLVERPDFWATALGIFADNPVLGTGLDTYGHLFLEYRPADHAIANGRGTTNAPHSVPLGMLSNGGLVLGLTYLVTVALVGVALVRGAFRAVGPERVALAGFGGVWWGYQAQSLVSFDTPPLAFLHWASAGVIVALAAPPRWREVRLPGPVVARAVNKRGKPTGPLVVPTSTRVLQGAIALVTLVAAWFAVYPFRADLVAASAAPLTSTGRLDEALVRFDKAARLNPGEPSYPFLIARTHDVAKRHDMSLAAAAEAARRAPGSVLYPLFAAQQAKQSKDPAAAAAWYREAVERDPKDPPVLLEAAAHLQSIGATAEARTLVERVLSQDPSNADAQKFLAALPTAA